MRRQILVILGLAALFALGWVSNAYATPPTISDVAPLDGANVTGGFTVTLNANDPNGVDGTHATVSVGGANYVPSVHYSGYWTGDGCDTWWVDDLTKASFECAIADPGPGTFVVTIAVPDALGEVATTSFTVTRTAALSFSTQSPAPRGRYVAVGRIAVTVSGPGVVPGSANVTIDGVAVSVTCEVLNSDMAVVNADRLCGIGTHTVRVSVGDGTDAPPASTTWTFVVDPLAQPPVVGGIAPAEGTTVSGAFQLTCVATDANKVNGALARVIVDGRSYGAAVTYAGHWVDSGCSTNWVEDRTQATLAFSISDLPPGSHTFLFEVPDELGNWATSATTLLRGAALAPTQQTPAESSRRQSVDRVSVVLGGGAVDSASVQMTIDGTAASTTLTEGPEGTLVEHAGALAEGIHHVRVSATGTLGSPPMSVEWTFVVDSTPPVVASASPSAGATMTLADAGIQVHLADADTVDVTSVGLQIDGVNVDAKCIVEVGGACARWTGTLEEGAHSASLVASDLAGNVLRYAWTFSVADRPRIIAVSPCGTLSPQDISLAVRVFDVNDAIDPAVRLAVDSEDIPVTLSPQSDGTVVISAQLAGLGDGIHNATVSVSDVSGNLAAYSWAFPVDAAGPSLTSQAPAAQSTLLDHLVTVGATFTDASPLDPAKASAWLDDAPVAISAVNGTAWTGTGCNSYEVTVPEVLILDGTYALADGSHSVRLRAVDAFGHETAEQWTFTVAEPPSVKVLAPVSGLHTNSPGIDLTADVSDFDGIASTSIAWRVAGSADWQDLSSAYDPTAKKLSASFGFPNGDTTYEFRFTASDPGGLITTATTSVYADAAAPAFDDSAMQPADSAVLTKRAVSFRGRFTDASAIDPASAIVLVDGVAVPATAQHETLWVGTGCNTYEEEIPGTLVVSGTRELHDGTHTLSVSAADVFGFRTTREWSFSVQEPPAISGVCPVAGARLTDTALAVSATVTDYDGIASTSVTWREANTGRPASDWQAVGASYNSSTGALAATIALPRTDTRYEVRVTAIDTGGLTTVASTNLFVAASVAHIEAGTACTSCHPTILQTHPMTDCTACHGNPDGLCSCHGTGVHGTWLLDSAVIDEHGGQWVGRTCTDCHSHQTDIESQRHSSGLAAECTECHEQSLTAAHAGLTVDGAAFTCSTCHASTSATVSTSIAEKNTACTACHSLASGHADLHKATIDVGSLMVFGNHLASPIYHGIGSVWYSAHCSMCHATTNLIAIHGRDCGACHGAGKPADSLTSWNGSCQQDACHPTIAHAAADAAHTAVANARCEEPCHKLGRTDYSVDEYWCQSCHHPATGAPTTTSDLKPSYIGTTTIHFSATGVAYTLYRLDGAAQVGGGKPLVVSPPPSGSVTHTLEYWSVSDSGYEELPHRTASFVISTDTIPPVTGSNARSSYIGPAVITLTPADDSGLPVAATYWRLDGGWQQTGTTVKVGQPSSGTQSRTLEFWSVDAFGNVELPHKTASFTVTADRVAPTTTIDAPAYTSTRMYVHLSAVDPDPSSGVASSYWKLNGGPTSSGSSFSYLPTIQGAYTIGFWSTDNAGNIEPMKTQTVIFDWTKPTTTSDALVSYIGFAAIHLSATDAISGVATTYYTLDGGAQQSGTDISVDAPGTHILTFWSVDKADNVEAQKRVTFTVE